MLTRIKRAWLILRGVTPPRPLCRRCGQMERFRDLVDGVAEDLAAYTQVTAHYQRDLEALVYKWRVARERGDVRAIEELVREIDAMSKRYYALHQ